MFRRNQDDLLGTPRIPRIEPPEQAFADPAEASDWVTRALVPAINDALSSLHQRVRGVEEMRTRFEDTMGQLDEFLTKGNEEIEIAKLAAERALQEAQEARAQVQAADRRIEEFTHDVNVVIDRLAQPTAERPRVRLGGETVAPPAAEQPVRRRSPINDLVDGFFWRK